MEGTGVYWKAPFEALEEASIRADLLHALPVPWRVVRSFGSAVRIRLPFFADYEYY